MVPSTHESDFTNHVLERAPEAAYGQTHWGTPPPLSCKKGGIIHSQENLQLAITTTEAHIRQAYKRYPKLKKDTGQRDTWIKQLIEAQAHEQCTMTKTVWKKL